MDLLTTKRVLAFTRVSIDTYKAYSLEMHRLLPCYCGSFLSLPAWAANPCCGLHLDAWCTFVRRLWIHESTFGRLVMCPECTNRVCTTSQPERSMDPCTRDDTHSRLRHAIVAWLKRDKSVAHREAGRWEDVACRHRQGFEKCTKFCILLFLEFDNLFNLWFEVSYGSGAPVKGA